ncbi:MAG: MotA/TolQ/ExbB proton channel family protein [Planctomycetota bacterium]
MWDIISKGGFFIYPLLLCSILALTFIIERLITLHLTRKKVIRFLERLNETIKTGSLSEAIELCDKSDTNLALIYKRGLEAADRKSPVNKDQVKTAFQESASVELVSLERNLGILSTVAHVAPLLGFLGTVTGMIQAFQQIQTLSNIGQAVGAGDLAGGIWEALITTAVGLVIAIPTYVAYAYFKSDTAKITNLLEKNALVILNQL